MNLEMQPLVPLLAYVIGPVTDLDSNPVGIEDEEGVVAREVRFLLRRAVDPGVHGQTALIGVIDFARIVDCEGEVLDPYFEVVVFAAVGLPEAQSGLGLGTRNMSLTEAEVDDILGSPISPKPALHREADRTKHAEVEGEGAVNISDREVDVVKASYSHSASSVARVRDSLSAT
jgi:hypothetical protein